MYLTPSYGVLTKVTTAMNSWLFAIRMPKPRRRIMMPEVYFKHEDVGGLVLDHVVIHHYPNHSELEFKFAGGAHAVIPMHGGWMPTFDIPGRELKGETITQPVDVTGCEPVAIKKGAEHLTAAQLMKLPFEQRERVLAYAASTMKEEYAKGIGADDEPT